jgi:tRNA pseudouridine55 synthase
LKSPISRQHSTIGVVDGVLVIDKPAGWTSHDVVVRARRILRESRIGHTGTLDPFATGVLVLLAGRATRLAQFVKDNEKEYEAIVRFGYSTDTGDITGNVLEDTRREPQLHEAEINSALLSLQGELDQIPPMYSAKKIAGRKLYELARRGLEVDRAPVRVCIHEIDPINQSHPLLKDNHDGTRDLKVRIVCSAGTYVRTLAEELAKRLGTSAHLAELRRTRAGDFDLKAATTLEQLKRRVDESALGTILHPPDAALSRMPFVHLTEAEERRARNGQDIRSGDSWPDRTGVRMLDKQGNLIGVGYFDEKKRLLHPQVILAVQKLH